MYNITVHMYKSVSLLQTIPFLDVQKVHIIINICPEPSHVFLQYIEFSFRTSHQ